ncbi:TonB-dependent receptor [Paucibacter soli]|uniref:TonB-dependent receptor n=1 Tax=Paucibacter soli TaxID=3133433 RepID=UPI0030A72001
MHHSPHWPRHAIGAACASLLLCGPLAVTGAQAQAAEPKSADAAETQKLELVVVSSQKRLEQLKDVPQAVSAYGANELKSQGIAAATELRQISPSLQFVSGADSSNQGFQMRGVGTSVFANTIEQSVGMVVDGVPLARSGQGSGGLIDVERIEVMRGPQGLLFGKNASAGLISVVGKRPRLGEVSAEMSLSYGEKFGELKTQLVANTPMGETGALRLAYASNTADGFITHAPSGKALNNQDEQMLRAKALFNLSNGLDVYVIADWSRSAADCCAPTLREATGRTQQSPPLSGFAPSLAGQLGLNGIVAGPRNAATNAGGSDFSQATRGTGLSVELEYDLGWASLTSISALRTWKTSSNNDVDMLPLSLVDYNRGTGDLKQRSQELRLTSPSGGRFEWVGGVFAYDQRNQGSDDKTLNLLALNPPAIPVAPGVTLPMYLASVSGGWGQESLSKNSGSALFGQAGVRLGKLKLSAGARYTHEAASIDWQGRPALVNGAPMAKVRPGFGTGQTLGRVSDNNLSWRLTAQADFSRDVMGYATAARGYKGPGLNFSDLGSKPVDLVRPEIPTTLEAGLRASLFDGQAAINAAVFKTHFDNFQTQAFVQQVDAATGVTTSKFVTANADRLNTQGVELEFKARVGAGWMLNAALAYVDASYGDYIAQCTGAETGCAAPAPGLTPAKNVSGMALTNAPKLSYNLGARYDTRIGDRKVFGQLNYNWRDRVSFSATGDQRLVQPAYGLLNASVGIGPSDGRWEVSVFGKNLGNQWYAETLVPYYLAPASGVLQYLSRNAYRSFGISATWRLGGKG